MEDEVEREDESQALLERMRNLKSKMRKIEEKKDDAGAVSYTHLTLPTIYSL